MTEEQLDKPPISKAPKKLSRREFLELSTVALGGLFLGSKIGNWLTETYDTDVVEKIGRIGLSQEAKEMMLGIVSFRESLGLEGLPPEVVAGLLKREQWTSRPDNFINALPEKNRSYSLRIFEVIQKLFGNNATRNIKGAETNPQFPNNMGFNRLNRFCNVCESVHNIPIQDQFTDFVLHEACGHGSDPARGANYPPEILIRVEHGKWRALSQALSIPDQFLNHPGDLMFPLLKKSIGETVGRFMTGGQESPIVDDASLSIVKQEVTRIARAKGKEPGSLKFNKRVCREIGETLTNLLREGKIKFLGDLKKTYQDKMEAACIEIYAEMVKYALIYPDKIQNNSKVIGGITEVISAVRGESDIVALREAIEKPSEEILRRNAAEKALISPTSVPLSTATLSPEEQERIRKQQEDFERQEKAFQGFADNGRIPETMVILDNQRETVQKFAAHYSKLIQKYPTLQDTFTQQYDENFDPEMHIWEIREIEAAMNSGFVRDLVRSQNISDQMIGEMTNKIMTLERFINSPAF